MKQPLHENQGKPSTRGERKKQKYQVEIDGFDLKTKSKIRNGLVTERGCTDMLCLIIFAAVFLTMIGISVVGYRKGNIHKIIGGIDGEHNICGTGSDDLAKYKNLYLTDLSFGAGIDKIFDKGVCVESCPSEDSTIDCFSIPSVSNCGNDVAGRYDTLNIAGYCFPKHLDQLPAEYKESWDLIVEDIKQSKGATLINDMQATRNETFICLGLGLVYSIIFIYMMSRCANCMTKIAILIIELCLVASIATPFMLRGNKKNSDRENKSYLIFGCCMVGVTLLFNMILCCFWKQVNVAIAIIDATADFFAATKRVIFVSVFYFFVTLIIIAAWLAGAAGALSLNDVQAEPNSWQGKDIIWNKEVKIMLFFMIAGLLWLIFFIQDKTGFICMVSASSYYFSSTQEKEGSASIYTGFHFAYTKHPGSIAMGSLIHTFVAVLRMIVEGIADAADKDGDNAAIKLFTCCIKCFVRCFENMVEYINKTAYAYMAVSGDSYCRSAWNGFLLNLKHHASFSFATTFAHIFVFMGKIFITCLNCATYYLLVMYGFKTYDRVSSLAGPLVIVALFSLVMAHIFLCLFDEAVIATMHCLAIDMDLNEGKPQFGPPTFHQKIDKIYGDSNKKHQAYQELPNQQNNGNLNGTIDRSNVNQMV